MGFGMTNGTGKTGYYAKRAYATANEASTTATEALELAEEAIERIEARVIKTLPTQDGALTYNGTEQSPTWNNVSPGSLTFGGVLAATNAGSYTATCTPAKGYKWEDGKVDPKNIVWTIGRQVIYDTPTQTGVLEYDGTEKTPTFANVDDNKMTMGGVQAATNVGTYNATATPKSNYQWPDGSVDAKYIPWSIIQEALTVPAQSGTVTYDGTAQSPTLDANYDSTKMTLSGDTTGTNAGTYTLTVSLTDAENYRWEDGTATPKSVSWTIDRQAITTVPTQSPALTYNNTTQTVTFADYDPDKLTLSGTTTGTDAGSYTAVFTPKANYQWGDADETDPKEVTWTIGKAAGSVSLSPASITLDTSTLTDTITVTRTGDGAISAVSSDTSIATVSLSGNTVTVTAVANGSATVTVSVAAGTNYLAPSDATVSVAVQLMPPVGLPLNDYSWEDISKIAQAGVGEDYFDIGDIKMITLNGEIGGSFTASNLSLGVFILDFNHKDNNVAENNIIFGGFKSALSGGTDVALIPGKYSPDANWTEYSGGNKYFNMNHWNRRNYGGWKGSDLRYDILGATSTAPSEYGSAKTTSNVGYDATDATLTNPVSDTFLAALPSDLRSKIRLRTHYVDNKGGQSDVDANVTAVTDAVFLLAEFEIFGSRTNANQYEQNHQAQMKYYANGNAKVKYKHNATGTATYWWMCSPAYNNTSAFCLVFNNGIAAGYNVDYALGLAPAFKV